REQATNPKARRTVRTSERFIDSAHALHVGGHVADLFRCEALGEGEHHDAVATRLIRVRSRVTRAARVVIELLHYVHRLWLEQLRVTGGQTTAPHRAVAGDAGRDFALGVAAQIERLAGFPVRGIRLEPGRALRFVVHRQIADVLIGERRGERLHDRVVAHARAEESQLLGDVDRALARETRPLRVHAVAVRTVAGRAQRRFGLAARRLAGGERVEGARGRRGCGRSGRLARGSGGGGAR